MNYRYPLRLTAAQWQEVKEHYEEPADDWTETEPEDIDFPDDHDRRFDDMYSEREGDIEE